MEMMSFRPASEMISSTEAMVMMTFKDNLETIRFMEEMALT